MSKLFAVRGATQAKENTSEAVLTAASELLTQLIQANQLQTQEVVSAFFTVTPDLDAAFPAAASRNVGWDGVAMLCSTEILVPGALPLAIRVLVQYHAPEEHKPQGVYLHGAESLRPDLFPVPSLPEIEIKLLKEIVSAEQTQTTQKQPSSNYLAQRISSDIKAIPESRLNEIHAHLQHLTMERVAFYWINEHGGGWCSTELGRRMAS